MVNYGFIITRHVRCEQTNRYWNNNVKLLRILYPNNQIIIIDDDSNYQFVKAENIYDNTTIIQSEYPKRGELLPYIYYLKYKWFPSAVILHDSVFLHKHFPFNKLICPVISLWHHPYDAADLQRNILHMISYLKNHYVLLKKLNANNNIISINHHKFTNDKFNLCFGAQCYIQLDFLLLLQEKYNIINLVNVIHNRTDRMVLERIMGLLFSLENNNSSTSLFGKILKHHLTFKYSYSNYLHDCKNNRIPHNAVKIWTGR